MPYPIAEFVVDVAGSPVHGRSAGVEAAPPVLLLHGASFSSAVWEQIGTLVALAELGCHATAIDLPGYGRSPRTRANQQEWLADLIHAISLPPCVIVSPSMSGAYSLPLLVSRPELVRGFVAVAPVGIASHLERLAGFAPPLLALWGENDRTIPVADGEALARTVANGKLTVIPGGSHAPFMNRTDEFHAALLPFAAACLSLPANAGGA